MNTGRAMIWLPTTREEKYRAKQTTDTFVVRTGDVLSSGVVVAGADAALHLVAGAARRRSTSPSPSCGSVVAWRVARKHDDRSQAQAVQLPAPTPAPTPTPTPARDLAVA